MNESYRMSVDIEEVMGDLLDVQNEMRNLVKIGRVGKKYETKQKEIK